MARFAVKIETNPRAERQTSEAGKQIQYCLHGWPPEVGVFPHFMKIQEDARFIITRGEMKDSSI